MKICIFTSTFLPLIGGVEYTVHYLAKYLTEFGHKVTVLTSRNKYANDSVFPYPVCRYRGLHGLFPVQVMRIQLLLEKLRTNFDILHAHRVYPTGYCAARLKNILNVPLIITPHGDDIQKMPEINYGMRLNPEIENRIRYAFQRASGITSISESIKRDILEIGGEEDKIYNLPNGIDLAKFSNPKNDIREMLNLSPHSKVILAVGGNHLTKGYLYLIHAMALVLKKRVYTKCVIIGRNTETLIPLIKKLNIQNSTILLGQIPKNNNFSQIPHDDLISCYMTSDIFVSPSLMEAFGIVNVEAMAAGLPIVATNVSGIRDVVKDGVNGFLIPPKEPSALAEKIMYLLENENLRKKMGEKSRKMVKQYDWKLITKKYIEAYRQIVSREQNDNA